MTEYNEFRVVLSPSLQEAGKWSVLLEECPVQNLVGAKGNAQTEVTIQQLQKLRSRHGWPNDLELKAIGHNVWQSLMTPKLEAAFEAGLEASQEEGKGMRLVFSIIGQDSQPAGGETIRMPELPLEALYQPENGFLATNTSTPISRSLKFRPDREPLRTGLPLRILVVVATPSDKPDADMGAEKTALQQALKKLLDLGSVEIEFCDPPTRAELTSRLDKKFHVLHFIGHGAFDIVGDDPSPRPHLCLEDDNQLSDPLDAETLDILLQGNDIRLVVITACSSAAPTPDEVAETVAPFDGLAQRLVGINSGVSAAVAMQFDLESDAAVLFSKVFYTNMLDSRRKLDEILTNCRKALAGKMNAGHRAWVTPVIYWRAREGKVFDIVPVMRTLDEQVLRDLKQIDLELEIYYKHIRYMNSQPEEVRLAIATLLSDMQKKVDERLVQRGALLGETVRLKAGAARAGENLTCQLNLRLRQPAVIGDLRIKLRYPTDKLTLVSVESGLQTAASPPLISDLPVGNLVVAIQDASQGAPWDPDEFELAKITFQIQAGAKEPIVEIPIVEVQVEKDGVEGALEALNGVVFVN
ncbi:MAG: CHAT domain-containing protein [Anaerolineales bacterium]|nr:CHAT domain-containing protein [Anaerolineales bacterium]